jgi:hypothetical protein
LYVSITNNNNADRNFTVTYNGVALTKHGISQTGFANSTNEIWYLVNPPVGTANLFIGVSSWYGQVVQASAAVFEGVDQTTPMGAIVAASQSSGTSPATLAITATADEFTVMAWSGVSVTGAAPASGQTSFGTLAAQGTLTAIHSYKAGASASVGVTWTSGATQTSRIGAVVRGVAASATATTLTGPTTGTVGVASSNFTAGADGAITGTVVVTPSDGGAGGTFTPTSVSISSGTPTATFTYTAASAGAKTISTTNNGGLANPASITYTASSGSVPVAFSGTVPGQSATVGVPFSLNLASYYSGTLTPFTYALQAGTLPAGLTLTGSTISGTPTTTGTAAGLVIRATDTGTNTANSNSFSIAVAAAPVLYGFKFSTAVGLDLGNFSGVLTGIGNEPAGNTWSYWVCNDVTRAVVVAAGPFTVASGGRLPDYSNAAIANATTYFVHGRRPDGAWFAARLVSEAIP